MFPLTGDWPKNMPKNIQNCVSWPAYLPECVYQQLNCPVEKAELPRIFDPDVFLQRAIGQKMLPNVFKIVCPGQPIFQSVFINN